MKGVSVPFAAAGTAAVKFAADSQDALKQFAASTGIENTTKSLEKYKGIMNDIYKDNFGESIGDVAEGMAKVQQNMSYLDDSALKRVTEYAFTLSDTFGVDIAESTRAADTLIKNYGVSAREAFNLMSQGAQQGLDFSGELFDNIDEYSVQFKKLGLDADDMFSVFANGAANGAFNLDKVGDAVKEFSIRAIDGSDTTAAGFQALGMDVESTAAKFAAGGEGAKQAFDEVINGLAKMEDPIAQNAAGVNLFGTMWEDLGPQVVTSLTTTNDAIDKSRESMEGLVNTKYDTLTSALGGLWRTVQVDVLQPIGDMLIPYVTQAIDKVKVFTDWWNSLGEGTQKAAVKFALIAVAVGPVLLVFGKLNKGISGAINSFGGIAKTVKEAGGILSLFTSPAGIVITVIAALATGAVLVYKNWDKITAVFNRVKDGVGDFASAAAEKIEGIKNGFLDFTSFIGDIFSAGVSSGLEIVGGYFSTWFEGIGEITDGIQTLFSGVIDFVTGVFTGNWEKAWNGLKDIVGGAFGALEGLVKTPINAVIGIVNAAIKGINNIKFTVPEWVPGIGGKGWQGLNIPAIPTLAKGTDDWKGGIVQISEKGGEIVDLPEGTRVYPHDESVRKAREEGEKRAPTITIAKLADQIIVKEEEDIDRIAEEIVRKIIEAGINMA